MGDIQPSIMTVKEVADWLRLPTSTIYKLCLRRKIPCIKIGKHWRFQRKHIETWFERKIQEKRPVQNFLEVKVR
jgi:excisionase family DNA binding protein